MLIFRYLAKEIFITLVALTTILLFIFMSNQFVHYLNHAANGQIPGMIIMKLMMIELPNLLGLLLPLGFYVALLLAYGHLYAEHEMIVLQACGYGPSSLLRHSFLIALCVSLFSGALMIWISPFIATERAKLLRASGVKTLIQTIVPGRFLEFSSGKHILYIETMNRNHSKAQQVFLARKTTKQQKTHWEILWADRAFAETDPTTKEDYIVIQHGSDYSGSPGEANYQLTEFKQYKVRLPHSKVEVHQDTRTLSTSSLLRVFGKDARLTTELHWRLAVPIMVLTLTLAAVPLSRVNPRAGKFSKLVPALILYIVYANFLFITRDWLITGKIPLWMGMWWLHGTIILIGVILNWRQRINLS